MGMYRRISVFMLPVAALLFATCCNQRGKSSMFRSENNVEFDTVSVVAHHHLEGDTANPYCNILVDFVYPVTSNKMNLEGLQKFFIRNVLGVPYDTLSPSDAVGAYVRDYIENYTADANTYRESVDEIKEFNSLISGMNVTESEHYVQDFFYSYYETLSDSIVYNRHGVLSFQVKQSNNKDGAVSYDSYRNYVLNLGTGKPVTENDIFNPGYDLLMQRFIVAALQEQCNVDSVEELEDIGFFGVREIMPNQNFLLNDKGIIYTFNKGEYSAYQLDAPVIFIPYETILSLLKENSIAAKLANL